MSVPCNIPAWLLDNGYRFYRGMAWLYVWPEGKTDKERRFHSYGGAYDAIKRDLDALKRVETMVASHDWSAA